MTKQLTFGFFILVSFLLFSNGVLSGQDRILLRPAKYDAPHKNLDFRAVPDSEKGMSVWFVMVANHNIQSTTTPGGNQRMKTLSFGEVFWVVEEQGNYLRLIKDDRRNDRQPSNRAENYGWVHIDNLLLWQRTLENPDSKISLKGLILNTTKALTRGVASYQKIQSYLDPELKNPTTYEARMFEIFYIYKYSNDGKSVLLGSRVFFNSGDQETDKTFGNLVGWFDIDRVLEWDHRLAVEPNWDPYSIDERKSKGINASVFVPANPRPEERFAREFADGRSLGRTSLAWDGDIIEKYERKSGYWRRFPVTGDIGNNIYKVMTLGELRGTMGTINEGVDIDVRQSLNEVINDSRKINVVFAIDGTNSMGPYYQSVINAVQNVVRIFESSGSEHKDLKFGYVVYRDLAERDRLVEIRQLTANSAQIINQLRNVEARDLFDTDTPEAVYYGLREAITKVFNNPHETNILIHIGDAGNHNRNDRTQVPQREIINLIADNFVYYIAFQAHREGDHPSYSDFPRQIKEIMVGASQRLYEKRVQMLGQSISQERPVLKEIDRNISRIEDGAPMVVVAAGRGNKMDVKILENEITRAIEEIDKYVDRVVSLARVAIERGEGIEVITGESDGLYTTSFAPGVYNLLLRMNIEENQLRNYYEKNTQLATEGYVSLYHKSLNDPVFRFVLLFESTEFSSLVHRVRTLRQSTGSSDIRDELYNTWVELLKGHIGVKPQGYYDEITLEKAASMVFGVPMRSALLDKIKLKDIHDPRIFPDTALRQYIAQIQNKYIELEKIQTYPEQYAYQFLSNDLRYFWIDVNMLP